MKLPDVICTVLEKTTPMSRMDLEDLRNKSSLWYEKNMKEATDKQRDSGSLALKDKIFLQLDTWYVRAALAVGYFWIVRLIQDWMRPGDDSPEPEQETR